MSSPVPQLAPAAIAERDREEFARAALDGLSRTPRAIPAKFLYDARGSQLFDQICELPEYYPTRTETKILRACASEIAERAGPGRALIEYGSGSSVKSRLLLDALQNLSVYAPIDISREHLDVTADKLRHDYPRLRVEPVCGDYMAIEALPDSVPATRRLGFFPGSTIGNLTPEEAKDFLRRARGLVGDDGAMVIGVDLRKDPVLLHAAYNDSAGVTAAFSLNLLRRMNRELDATLDLAGFAHEAFYNEDEGRIEIYLRSLRSQTAMVAGWRFMFAQGERIHTEYSYKYDDQTFATLVDGTGFHVDRTWIDDDSFFAVHYLVADSKAG